MVVNCIHKFNNELYSCSSYSSTFHYYHHHGDNVDDDDDDDSNNADVSDDKHTTGTS